MGSKQKKRLRRKQKLGLPPGTMVYTGEPQSESPILEVIEFSDNFFEVRQGTSAQDVLKRSQPNTALWINVDGVHDTKIIGEIGKALELHPLTLEDIVATDQRPRYEVFDSYLYVVAKMLHFGLEKQKAGILTDHDSLLSEQVTIICKKDVLVTFQELQAKGDVFDFVRERLKQGKGRVRKMGLDYLLYSLLDAVVDYYFVILEELGEEVEKVEDIIVLNPDPSILPRLYRLKRTMLAIRRAVWPLREVVSQFLKDESEHIDKSTTPYIQDLYGHVIQVIDNVELHRETLASLLEVYLSSTSNKLNNVMKFLTVIATIFMPLTFITGLYGMNFEHMPGIHSPFGFYDALLLMAGCVIGMLSLFKVKKWL